MSDSPLRIAWIGFHQEGIPALRGLLTSGVSLLAVITLEDSAAARRSAAVSYSDVLTDFAVPLHHVKNINDPDSLTLLRSLQLDLMFVIGWSQILSTETLATARLGAIGAHASLLPRNRGSAPINWSLIRGETATGNTLIWLTDGVDEGQIIDQMVIPVTIYDTCETLYRQVAETNHVMIQRLLPRLLAGERPGRIQEHIDQPLLPRRRPSDGQIDWSQSAHDIYNFIRALTRPYPGAFSALDGEQFVVQSCALLPAGFSMDNGKPLPGTVIGPVVSPIEEGCGALIACGSGFLILLELQADYGRILKGRMLSEIVINDRWSGKIWKNEP